MRKRLITPSPQDAAAHDEGWLDLDRLAVVEVTSEDKDYPVESALAAEEVRGWRAPASGTQTVRLIFDEPQRLTRIALVFEETETERTQEFVLRWSGDGGRSFREVVRQQWNFSPPNTSRERNRVRPLSRLRPQRIQCCLPTLEGLVCVHRTQSGRRHRTRSHNRSR